MRTWVYQTLLLCDLWTETQGRLYQASRMTQQPDKRPYAVYRMGASSGQLHSTAPVLRTPFQLFVYDEAGDYLRIEALLQEARTQLTLDPPALYDARYINCSFLEYSSDLPEDPLTGTIAKFARFSLVHK